MNSAVVRADPAQVSTTLKEAVVDSLLNLTFARISGHGPDGEVLYGSRPRSILASAFLLPPLRALGSGDEVTQPIRITAHGFDCQIHRDVVGVVTVQPRLQVYVRVLPSVEDLRRPDCAPRFRLDDAVRRALQTQTSDALKVRWSTESSGKTYKRRLDHPQWKTIEQEVRNQVLEQMGLPKNITTLFSIEEDSGETNGDGDGAGEGVLATGGMPANINDALFRPMELPHKWRRIPLSQDLLPALVIDPALPGGDLALRVQQASLDLTAAVQKAIRDWANSDDGKNWCFRQGVVVFPSQYRSWQQFLDTLRADTTLQKALPDIDLAWQVKVSPDWSNPGRSNLHVSLENTSAEPRRGGDMTDQSVFQMHLDVEMPTALHAPLKLGRIEASYRYNRYLEYPAIGFNGGIQSVPIEDPAQLRLQTTWAPRYTQPRILPKTYEGIDPTMRRLAEPDGLAQVLPLETALDDWYKQLDKSVDLKAGLAPTDTEALQREQGGFSKDKEGWLKEIEAVRAGLRILEESKSVWDQTAKRGPQPDERAAVYEAWLSMNETMANVIWSPKNGRHEVC